MNNSNILVLGGTGKVGRRVVERLSEKGYTPRIGSRQSAPRFDWEDSATWPAVLEGTEALYISFFPDLAVPEAPAAIEELTRLAAEAGVERIVLLSGRGESNAQRCENIVRGCSASSSGVNFTLLRASWFAQNFNEGHLLGPVLEGVVAFPAGDVREPFVDVEDIAEAAVVALTEDRHAGELYELTGPELLCFSDACRQISMATGRRVGYQPITLDQYRSVLMEVAPELADFLTDLCAEVLDGRNEWLGDGVQKALGREPRSFGDYCTRIADSGGWDQ